MSNKSVIFHVDELAKWPLVLGNVSNLLKAVGPRTMAIEVLANAEAVCLFATHQDSPLDRTLLDALSEQGVLFAACNNALVANGVETGNLPSFVQIVPAGILELINKQGEGYAYIRP